MNKGIKIHILNIGLIKNTPMRRLIVTNLLAFAEFERAMIIERTQGGKAITKQRTDFKEGRPKKFNSKKITHALELLQSHSYRQVEEMTGISKSTLIREKGENNYNGDFDILSRAFCVWQSASCTHYPHYSYNKTDKQKIGYPLPVKM